jgi:amino acid transporter
MQKLLEIDKEKLAKKINFETFVLILSTLLYTVYSTYDLLQTKIVGEPIFNLTFILILAIVAIVFFIWSYSRYQFFLDYNNNSEDQKTYRKTAFGAAISRFIPIIGIYFGYIMTQEIANNKSEVRDNRIMWLFYFQCLVILLTLFTSFKNGLLVFTVIDFVCGTWAVLICRQTQLKIVQQI